MIWKVLLIITTITFQVRGKYWSRMIERAKARECDEVPKSWRRLFEVDSKNDFNWHRRNSIERPVVCIEFTPLGTIKLMFFVAKLTILITMLQRNSCSMGIFSKLKKRKCLAQISCVFIDANLLWYQCCIEKPIPNIVTLCPTFSIISIGPELTVCHRYS